MSLVVGASRNVSLSDDKNIWKFFTEGFKNLPSSFFLIPKICYGVLNGTRGLNFSSRLRSFIKTFTRRSPIIMVLLFQMKQILILVRMVFVELIYLSSDLKTINCQTWWFFVFSLKIFPSFKNKQQFCVFASVLALSLPVHYLK